MVRIAHPVAGGSAFVFTLLQYASVDIVDDRGSSLDIKDESEHLMNAVKN
jgi:hypothetical protein